MATKAQAALLSGDGAFDNNFYKNKIHTMKFFFKYEMTRISGLRETLMHPECLTILEEDIEILA
jgi:butyryl-CoA dehydrogenase